MTLTMFYEDTAGYAPLPPPTPSNMSRVCVSRVSRQSSRLSLHLVLVPLTQYVS